MYLHPPSHTRTCTHRNLNAEAATMPSLGNQYFAFGGSLPELSLTSLTRLLPNSSANDPNISSCPSLFTLFHPPLYVYPSQQHLTTPFINANGSISFGSFLSSGTSLCSMQKTSSGGSNGNGNGITSSSSNQVTSSSSSGAAATSSNSSTIITGKANKVDDSPGAYGRAPLAAQQQGNQPSDAVKLSTMYSPIIGGAQVITALPGFSTIAAARGFNSDPTATATGVPQSNSSTITSHTITASTHSNLTPLYSTAVAPTSTVTHVAAPNCNLNTLACVATAQMQQQQQRQGMSPDPRPPPHHLPITHPSTDPHLHQPHQPHQPHHAAATTPTPTGAGGGVLGSATTPTHDSKEGILAAMHGSAGANTGTAIEVYNIGGNSAAALIPGAVNVNRIEIKGDHSGRLTQSPVDMSQPHGHGVAPLMPMDMSQPHLQAQQQADMSPGGSGGMKLKKEKDKPYKCDHPGCGRSFSFPAHLRSHIQQIHISYRPCKCEFPGCGKRFYTPQHLNVHRRVHTGERPFICPYADCGKAFTTAGNLKNHIRTHTGERPYACKYDGCLKRFAEMSSLKKHELTHTGEKPYKCRVCGKAFSQAGSRNTHERKHNPVAEEGDVPGDQVGKSNRRYRIKRVPVVANGTASITSPGTIVEDPSAMQH